MRTVTETIVSEHDGRTTVSIVSEDEYGDKHVGTRSYDNDTWHTNDDRDRAYREATEDSLNG